MNKSDLISKYESKLILKNYSERTIQVYLSSLGIFLHYIQRNKVRDVTSEILQEFFKYAQKDLCMACCW